MTQSPFDLLAALLDEEAHILRRGDLQALEALAVAKERALQKCRTYASGAKNFDMEGIRKKARRNARFLVGAKEGLIAARDKLSRAQTPPQELRTYGSNGDKRGLGLGRDLRDLKR